MATETRKELIAKFDWIIEKHNMGEIELNNWEEEFLVNIEPELESEDGFLTDLQIEKLEQIYDKYSE